MTNIKRFLHFHKMLKAQINNNDRVYLKMDFYNLVKMAVEKGASDIHLASGNHRHTDFMVM